jgi:secondary thiamine-phosphate synthase enzyme
MSRRAGESGSRPETIAECSSPLRSVTARLHVATAGRHMVDITGPVDGWLAAVGAESGLLTLFLRHTSAGLTIQENTDPDVLADLRDALDRLAPERAGYRHDLEGPDDMPAHIKSSLTGVSLAVPVVGGRMDLGTWQAVYVVEHRAAAHRREVTLHYLGS